MPSDCCPLLCCAYTAAENKLSKEENAKAASEEFLLGPPQQLDLHQFSSFVVSLPQRGAKNRRRAAGGAAASASCIWGAPHASYD